MKTKPMSQQVEAMKRLEGKRYYALFMEQGTGKTWVYLADAERAFKAGKIGALLVGAPQGVHTNWVRREIPKHMDIEVQALAWRAGMGKAERREFDKLLEPKRGVLQVLSMNLEGFRTADGFDFALQFAQRQRPMFTLDESHRIKNPDAVTTKQVMKIRPHAVAARIGTGSPATKSPADMFAQFEFLWPGLLRTRSYRAFVAEYTELLKTDKIADILARQKKDPTSVSKEEYMALDDISWAMRKKLQQNPRMAFSQIAKRDENGAPIYRNLDKLQALIAPYSYRVLKKDCLDLPPKIYTNHYFDLSPKQRAAYTLMEDELRIQMLDGEVTSVSALASLMKLCQITSGFVKVPGEEEPMYVSDENPRLDALMEKIEDTPGKIIVWARFQEEIRAIAERLTAAGIRYVEYHGGIKKRDRDGMIDDFQNIAEVKIFLGQQQAGGTGLTLTAADSAFYYSNDFDHGARIQSEDRCHRIGTEGQIAEDGTRHVLYVDFMATATIDESMARSHQNKSAMAAEILGDRKLDMRGFI